jgi:hypothetical protein
MAESVFQSIRGAQFRGSRFPGFRSTGQQADSGVDPATAALASENAQSWTGPRPGTALNAQSFGGSDFSASTAPAGAPAPNGGGQLADAVSRGIDAITPNVSTTGGIISTVGRGVGALVGGLPGLALGGAARAGGALIDANEYDRQLSERGLPGIDRSAAVLDSVNIFTGRNSPNSGANQFADRIAAESRTLANSPVEAENMAAYQDSTNANPSDGPQSWTGDNVSPGQAVQSQSTTGVGNPEDTGTAFGGTAAPSEDGGYGNDYSGPSEGGGASTGGGTDGGATGGATDGSNDSGGSGFAKGGHVTADRLKGPNPPGPDDGYAALDVGETVITAEATRRYGKDVMMALNKGLVSPEAVRRLLG